MRIERNIGRQRPRRIGHDQRVAIGRRVHDLLDANRAAGAGPVLDDDGLTDGAGHAIEYDTGDDVGNAGGGEGHHDLDRPVGIVRGLDDRRQEYGEARADEHLKEMTQHELAALID